MASAQVIFRGQERLNWSYLITKKPNGGVVKLTVIRRRAAEDEEDAAGASKSVQLEFELSLRPLPLMVPRVLGVDYHSAYIIVGGLVILPAGGPLQGAALKERRYRLCESTSPKTAEPTRKQNVWRSLSRRSIVQSVSLPIAVQSFR